MVRPSTIGDRIVELGGPCMSYALGHQLHAIQARKAAEDRWAIQVVERTDVAGDDILLALTGGEVVCRRTHDVPKMQAAIEQATHMELRTHGVLAIAVDADLFDWRLFSVAKPEEWKPCEPKRQGR